MDMERYIERIKEYSDTCYKAFGTFIGSGFTEEQAMQILLAIISNDNRRIA